MHLGHTCQRFLFVQLTWPTLGPARNKQQHVPHLWASGSLCKLQPAVALGVAAAAGRAPVHQEKEAAMCRHTADWAGLPEMPEGLRMNQQPSALLDD